MANPGNTLSSSKTEGQTIESLFQRSAMFSVASFALLGLVTVLCFYQLAALHSGINHTNQELHSLRSVEFSLSQLNRKLRAELSHETTDDAPRVLAASEEFASAFAQHVRLIARAGSRSSRSLVAEYEPTVYQLRHDVTRCLAVHPKAGSLKALECQRRNFSQHAARFTAFIEQGSRASATKLAELLERTYQWVLLAGFLLLLSVIGVSALVFRRQRWDTARLLRPLSELQTNVIRLSQGDYSPPDPIQSDLHELTLFSETFTQMGASLGSTMQALEERTEAAEAAAVAKSSFLAMMSHEIRTPMNGVIAMATLLLETQLSESQRKQISLIEKSGNLLLDVINDVLDFSQMEAGKLEIVTASFDLHSTAQHTIELHQSRAQEKGLKLSLSYESNVARFFIGDQARIQQILNNLVGNGIKFTETGTVNLVVHGKNVPGTRVPIRIAVHDTGIGIKEEKLDGLFEEFSQVEDYSKRRKGGSGLGLAITQRLVRLMGGQLGVTSTFGKSSSFWISLTLPCQSQEEAEKLPPLNVLVVEDNVDTQVAVRTMLQALGHTMDLALDAAEAVTFVQVADYDLVLLDCLMPNPGDVDAVGEIRALEGYNEIPIIALARPQGHQDEFLCIGPGINDLLPTPLQRQALEQVIKKWCRPRAS